MIIEDDCEFLVTRKELDLLIAEFRNDKRLDILCLGNFDSSTVKVSKNLNLTNKGSFKNCFILKEYVIQDLITTCTEVVNMFENGETERLSKGETVRLSKIDLFVNSLQGKYNFVKPRHQTTRQKGGYSDIRLDFFPPGN